MFTGLRPVTQDALAAIKIASIGFVGLPDLVTKGVDKIKAPMLIRIKNPRVSIKGGLSLNLSKNFSLYLFFIYTPFLNNKSPQNKF